MFVCYEFVLDLFAAKNTGKYKYFSFFFLVCGFASFYVRIAFHFRPVFFERKNEWVEKLLPKKHCVNAFITRLKVTVEYGGNGVRKMISEYRAEQHIKSRRIRWNIRWSRCDGDGMREKAKRMQIM